jgi:hypothetical protein
MWRRRARAIGSCRRRGARRSDDPPREKGAGCCHGGPRLRSYRRTKLSVVLATFQASTRVPDFAALNPGYSLQIPSRAQALRVNDRAEILERMPLGFRLIGVRSKYRFALLLFHVNALVFAFLSLYVSAIFLLGVFVTLFIFGWYVMRLRCPTCNKPVLYNVVTIFPGIKTHGYTLTIPRHCTRCGAPLD